MTLPPSIIGFQTTPIIPTGMDRVSSLDVLSCQSAQEIVRYPHLWCGMSKDEHLGEFLGLGEVSVRELQIDNET